MTDNKRVSMRDLAREAGVSVMTVSLALRNQPGVSEQTRQRIQDLALKKGYRPDPALSALISYRRNKSSQGHLGAVAFLTFQDIGNSPDNYIKKMYDGACREADKLGYRVYMFEGPTTPAEATRLKRILHSRGIRGIMLSPISEDPKPTMFDWKEFSVVCLGVSFRKTLFHTVSGDTYHGCFVAAAQLYHAGCHRIGLYFTHAEIDRVEQRYYGGASAYLSRFGDSAVMLPPLYTNKYSRDEFLHYYKLHRPEGLITGFGDLHERLKPKGIRIPEDLSIISPHYSNSLTYLDQQFPEWGSWAMKTLAGLIKNNEVGAPESPIELLIRGKLVHRNSVKGTPMSSIQEQDAHLFPVV